MADTVLDGLNRYTYVRNNPLIYTDPTGHEYCPPGDAGCEATFGRIGEYNRALGCMKSGRAADCYVRGSLELSMPFGICGNGRSDECESIAEKFPGISQGVVNVSAASLDTVTFGNGDELLAVTGNSDKIINTDSRAYFAGQLAGTAFNIWAGGGVANFIKISTGAGLVNAGTTCSGISGGSCVADLAMAFAPAVLDKIITSLVGQVGSLLASRGAYLSARATQWGGSIRNLVFGSSGPGTGVIRGWLGRNTASSWSAAGQAVQGIASMAGNVTSNLASLGGARATTQGASAPRSAGSRYYQ